MALRLEWINDQDKVPLPEEMHGKLQELLAIAGEAEGIAEGEVVVTIVDDEQIRELNLQYRGLDKPTDVLSFSMLETGEGETEIRFGDWDEDDEDPDDEDADGADPGGEDEEEDEDEDDEAAEGAAAELELPIGDIVISAETALRQSEEYGHSFERELGFLFVHGFLHLIGYDHQDAESERVMTEKQEQVLQKAGLYR